MPVLTRALGSFIFLFVAGTVAAPASNTTFNYGSEDKGLVLKLKYIACEKAAQANQLDGASIALCSEIYENLKDLEFNGNFHEIRIWYDSMKALGSLETGMVGYSLLP